MKRFVCMLLAALLACAACALAEETAIPELQGKEIRFTSGRKYPVYSAPGADSLRGANGKAAVIAKDGILVFGREGDWLLIEYSIEKDRYRIGYIDAAALPKNAQAPALAFAAVEAEAVYPVRVTDDPLHSKAALGELYQGERVAWLANLGDWAYIGGDGFRGFVPAASLTSQPAAHAFASYTDEDGLTYPLFEVKKMHYDQDHRVYAVTGAYERVALHDECYGPDYAGPEITYSLAADFSANMTGFWNGGSDEEVVPFSLESDLYQWYIESYLRGEEPENGELIFACDLPEDSEKEYNFWFFTARIELNGSGEIAYMEFEYVPWM